MQLDWLTAVVATPPDLAPRYQTGEFLRIDQYGEVVKRSPAALQVEDPEEPSSSSTVRVWTPEPHRLFISGNPVKVLQGHNLFGSCDIPGLYLEAGAFVRKNAGLFPSPGTWEALQFGLPRFTRLDITRSYRFPSIAAAQSYIRYVAGAARSRHGSAKLYGSETAIFGEGSSRWSMKIYDKWTEQRFQEKKFWRRLNPFRSGMKEVGSAARELMNEALCSKTHAFTDELMAWSEGIVRFELTLRALELEGMQRWLVGRSDSVMQRQPWPVALLEVWKEYFQRITFNENAHMTHKKDLLEDALSASQRAVLRLWRVGADLREIYPQNTFYRHRRALLELVGVDIANPPASEAAAKETPAALDPAGWDPEPIESCQVEPSEQLKAAYRLV